MTTMVLSDIGVDVEEARAKVEQYRSVVKAERTSEDTAIAHAFSVAAKGKRIITLNETVRAGGVDELGRPRIAVCRATATRCAFRERSEEIQFWDDQAPAIRDWTVTAPVGRFHLIIPWQRENRMPTADGRRWPPNATAIVPIVPPALRPPRRHRRVGIAPDPLAACHIIWEAEWTSAAPRDPALVRQIGALDLWEVLATWDLTELERAVITSTRRA